ncbi:MAG: glycosyltransferase family A protein [Gallionellaceae bacterium]|nr:glycosyltransferase family A protein [Gallionellaceae bacterium]MDD5364648.1 glycosyltransferase family A protein [Gallionellaceae bacterium]
MTALLPAHQASEFIQPTLDSLSAQTFSDFTVIISVDRCDDDTHAICMKHCARDPRFRVIQQEQRLGYAGNCNFLLDQADAEYVLFAFHDDILAPSYIEKLCAVLDTRPEVVLSYSDLLLTAVDGTRQNCIYTGLDGMTDRAQRGLKMLERPDMWWVPNRGLFRLQEARRIHGIKTHDAGEFSVDWPWLFHMSLLGEFARVPEILCDKFWKPGSLSRSWAFSKKQYYEASAACLRELWNSDLSSDEKLMLAAPLTRWMVKAKARMQPRAPSIMNRLFHRW